MTKKRDLKLLIRKRMEKTGESYSAARRHVESMSSKAEDNSRERKGNDSTSDRIKGWFPGGAPEDYEFRIDNTQGRSGLSSAVIRSLSDKPGTSAKLMQYFLAEKYRGRRLRFSGWIRSENITASCSLWMRIDENTRLLIFAHSSALAGTNDWTQRQVVLDVDEEATLISIGVAIAGAGTAWISDIALEIVGIDIPTTATRNIPLEPRNLNFSE
jgi:hypothetical protein